MHIDLIDRDNLYYPRIPLFSHERIVVRLLNRNLFFVLGNVIWVASFDRTGQCTTRSHTTSLYQADLPIVLLRYANSLAE